MLHQTIVVGSKARDFCYAQALSRVGVPALWLPAGLLDEDEYGSDALRALIRGLGISTGRPQLSDQRIMPRSLSLPHSDVEAIAQRISDELRNRPVEVVDEVVLPDHRIPFLGDWQHYDDQLEEPFDGDTMVRRLPPIAGERTTFCCFVGTCLGLDVEQLVVCLWVPGCCGWRRRHSGVRAPLLRRGKFCPVNGR